MTTINKKTIQEKIIGSELEKAIKMLLELANKYDGDLYNEMIMLSARYNALEKEKRNRLISDDAAKTNMARINFALTELTSKIKETWEIKSNGSVESEEEEEAKRKTILFLAANPKDSEPLRLDEEIRNIEEGLRRSKNRDYFELKQKWALRITDLRRALLDENPNIIHFSGHGSELGRIYLESPVGESVEIDSIALANLFELFKDQIDCVLLNACYSEHQAQEISKHINYVIGMSDEVPDEAAIAFSEAFYDAIANGRDIEFAFKLAKNAIELYNLGAEQIPILIRKMH